VSIFGETKLAAEQAVLGLRSERFVPVVFRTATMYGWSRRMRFDLAVNQMTATAVRQGRIVVRGGGAQWRPFVHVRDAARAMVLGVEADADRVAGEVFNLGSDAQNFRIGDLAWVVADRIGNVRVEVARDDDDQRNFRVRFGKIVGRLGFEAEHGIEEGISEVRRLLEEPAMDPMAEQYFNVARMKRLRATPVDAGGEPIAARFIPLSKPSLGAEEEQAVLEALRSGWLTSGPNISAFERSFAELLEARHAVAVNSCTAALHLCLVELGVRPGDEVITSPITWSSTGNTILNMGARPVFVDVDPATLNMDPALLEAAIGPRTKAIMPVHIAGHPCDMASVASVAAKHGVPVVEDAAHALGASWHGQAVGTISPYTCFSFYAVKNITTMEGGMITLSDADRAAHLRFLATNGMSATAWDRYGRSAVAAPQEVVEPGYKYHLGNVAAAMGLQQLRKLPRFLAARRRLAEMYSEVLREVEEVELPPSFEEGDHAWHLYIIRFRLERLSKSRDELAHALRRENIGTGVHFYGLHLHRYYRERLGMKPEDLPHATEASRRILSLPLHPEMSDKNVHEVVMALKKVLAHARK
jgi:dTDP-4-amino-4,6-dideoxygalactose transaminase